MHDTTETNQDPPNVLTEKSRRDEKALWYVPWHVTSFDELASAEFANEKAEAYNLLSNQFLQIAENILWASDEEVPNKDAALSQLANDMAGRMEAIASNSEPAGGAKAMLRKALAVITGKAEAFGEEDEEEDEEDDEEEEPVSKSHIMFTKQADGSYRWLATYSNSVLDKHNEIISSESHIRFEKMVDSGVYEYPELWLHHEKAWKFGVADFIATDVRGDGLVFAIAGGTVDKGFEKFAEELSGLDLAVSHGMAPEYHQFHEEIPGLIVQHKTVEISPLLRDMEANDLTLISISKEASTMAVSKQKKDMYAARGIGLDQLDSLEQANGHLAGKALTEGRIHKENSMNKDDGTTQPDETPEVEPGTEKGADPTLSDVIAAVKELGSQLLGVSESTATGLTGLNQKFDARLKALEDRLSEVEGNKANKEALTPAASLDAIVKSVIGDDEAKVDGRSALAKSGPQEQKEAAPAQGGLGIPFLDKLRVEASKGSYTSPALQTLFQGATAPVGVNGDGGSE